MTKKKEEKFKLNGIHKEYVINRLALHCGLTEIAESLKIDFDVDVTPQAIEYYKREYEEEWREKRSYFNKHIAEIEPFADKAQRVQKRGDLIRDIEEKGLWYTLITQFGKHEKGNHGAINDLLDSIKKEIEPFKIAQTNPDGDGPVEINVKLID